MRDSFIHKTVNIFVGVITFILPCYIMSGCAESGIVNPPPPTPPAGILKSMNYCIQVGAFMNMDNAIGLMNKLNSKGLDAYYFKDSSGLYKVRFGNHQAEATAREIAAQLQAKGVIEEYFIIKPEDYAAAQAITRGKDYLREQLVKTAENFVGMPYHWGGSSAKQGFDCSGLTMAVYRLNGLELDRTAGSQYQAGKPIIREALQAGDLVFFTTRQDKKVSHVGIFLGQDQFIHATSTGKNVRTDSLSQTYWVKTYVGARTYI
jgi:cell wall-associated NlpC family hydrolase